MEDHSGTTATIKPWRLGLFKERVSGYSTQHRLAMVTWIRKQHRWLEDRLKD